MLALSAASLDVLPGVVLGERGRSLLFTTSLQDWRRPAIRFAAPSERTRPMAALPNIVLVHGAWADGSCWSDVIERLQADGYKVTAPQLPESSLADDVARVRHVLTRQSGPTVLAGHSWGGQVMTALGTDAPNVTGLVYVAAFGLEEGETLGALLGG